MPAPAPVPVPAPAFGTGTTFGCIVRGAGTDETERHMEVLILSEPLSALPLPAENDGEAAETLCVTPLIDGGGRRSRIVRLPFFQSFLPSLGSRSGSSTPFIVLLPLIRACSTRVAVLSNDEKSVQCVVLQNVRVACVLNRTHAGVKAVGKRCLVHFRHKPT